VIVALDPANPAHRRAAASLHNALLPESPIAKLGRLFMEGFYYNHLVREGLIACDLYSHDGRFVGFAAYTKEPYTFMERGKKAHFFYLSAILAACLAVRPSRIKIILEALKTLSRRVQNQGKGVGELLSFGVEPAFSSHRDAASGKKVPHLMFGRVMAVFRREGFSKIQFIIRKDNQASLLFFNSYGAVIREADYTGPGFFLLDVSL